METVPKNRFTPGLIFFVTINVKKKKPVLVEEGASELIFETLQFFRRSGEIKLYSFAIMPDHVHVLVKLREDVLLSNIVRRFKSYVAKNLEKGPLWVKGCWSKVASSWQNVRDATEYIHLNPVKARLTDAPEKFKWSSARAYQHEDASAGVDFWWAAES